MAFSAGGAAANIEVLAAELRAHGITNAEDVLSAMLGRVVHKRIEEFEAEGEHRNVGPGLLAKVLREGGSIGSTKDKAPDDEGPHTWTRDWHRFQAIRLADELAAYGEGRVVKAARALEAEGRPVTARSVKAQLDRAMAGDANPPGPLLSDRNDPAVVGPRAAAERRRKVALRIARHEAAEALEDASAPPSREAIDARARALVAEAEAQAAERERLAAEEGSRGFKRLRDGADERRKLPLAYRYGSGWRVTVRCQGCGVRVQLDSPDEPGPLALRMAASMAICDECVVEEAA